MILLTPETLPRCEPPLDPRVPDWVTIATPLTFECPMCEALVPAPALQRSDGAPLSLCEVCGLWFVSRRPAAPELYEYYQRYWQDHRPVGLNREYARAVRCRARSAFHQDLQLTRLNVLLPGGLEGRRVLDIGCGTGEFLARAAAAGAEPIGVDASRSATDFITRELGFECYHGTLEERNHEIGTVDAVVMTDLIEHPLLPMVVLQAALAVLRPSGLLSLWTPNGGAAGTEAASARTWPGFRWDLEHLQYLSPQTINWFASRFNLTVEHCETLGAPRPPSSTRTTQHAGSAGLRALVHAHPFIYEALRSVRERHRRPPDERAGNYHLFAILRKGA